MILAAYDFGTTGCKASFYHADGVLAATAYHEYPTYFPRAGWVEQDPQDWKNALAQTTQTLLQRSKIEPKDIACLSFSGHMMGCVPVDSRGAPLCERTMLWADNRSKPQAERILRRLGWERFYTVTGGGLDVVLYPAAKIPWIKENQPELYRKADKFLGVKDVICAWLTGTLATDYSEASNFGLLHLSERHWHKPFFEALDISPDKMPQVVASTTVVGKLTPQAAKITGLLAGTPVVLGGGDVSCGTAGAGAVAENIPYMCIGSAGWIAVAGKEPIFDLVARPMSLCHVVPELYTTQIIMYSAGIAYKWMRDEIFLGDGSATDPMDSETVPFERMDQLARTASPGAGGVIFLPYMRSGGAPYYDLDASAAFLGISLTTQKADLLRATLEGVAYNLRMMVKCLERSGPFKQIRIIGGGANSRIWKQILANVMQKDILTLSAQQEANTLGAALVGGVGVGLLADFAAIEKFSSVQAKTTCDPDQARRYDDYFAVFAEAYQNLRKTRRVLARLNAAADEAQ